MKKSKLASISLITLMYLIITSVLITTTIVVVSKHSHSNAKNQLDAVSSTAQSVIDQAYRVKDKKFTDYQRFPLLTNELYMFFSAGDNPIYLSRKDSSYSLKFERPDVDECDGTACICHCEMQAPPWKETSSEPYMESAILKFQESKQKDGYRCSSPLKCSAQGDKTDNKVFFGNSRGRDDEFYDDFLAETKIGDKKDYFTPFPMDIVTLLYDDRSNSDGNIFFSDFPGDDYNLAEQQDDYVKYLSKDYVWENGVVIGGTGASNDKKTFKKHKLNAQTITLKIESTPKKPGVIGVCTLKKSCLYKSGIDYLNSLKNSADLIAKAKEDSLEEFSHLSNYFRNDLVKTLNNPDLTQKEFHAFYGEFSTKLKTFFKNQAPIPGYSRSLIFKKIDGDTTKFILSLGFGDSIIAQSDVIPLKFPFDSNSATPSQFNNLKSVKIIFFDGKILRMGDNSERKIVFIKTKSGTNILGFFKIK